MKKLFSIYVERDEESAIVELGVRILGVKIGLGLMLDVQKGKHVVCGALPFVSICGKEADND